MIVWPAGVITENRASFSGSAAAGSVSASAWGSGTDVIFKSLRISGLYSSAAFLSCSSTNRAASLQNTHVFLQREGSYSGISPPATVLQREHKATL